MWNDVFNLSVGQTSRLGVNTEHVIKRKYRQMAAEHEIIIIIILFLLFYFYYYILFFYTKLYLNLV